MLLFSKNILQWCSIVKLCSWTCHARKCVLSSQVEPWAGRPQGPHGCGDALQGVGPLSIVVTAALGYLAWELHQSLGEGAAHNTWPQGVEQERMWRVPWMIFFNLKIKRNFWFIRIDSNSIQGSFGRQRMWKLSRGTWMWLQPTWDLSSILPPNLHTFIFVWLSWRVSF